MSLGNSQFEIFLEALRQRLIPGTNPPTRECWSYVVRLTKAQSSLLPSPFSLVFQPLTALTVAAFVLTPSFLHAYFFTLFRRLPGFSGIILYHEKIMAAAELEFHWMHSGDGSQ
ncbi:MAG: hypothetical protein ACXWQO_13460 [Bdellovibrionota bacterium]